MNKLMRTTTTAAAGTAILLGGAGLASANSDATGAAIGSPGVISGNDIQVPITIPINICGNSVNLVGILNPAFGNVCINR